MARVSADLSVSYTFQEHGIHNTLRQDRDGQTARNYSRDDPTLILAILLKCFNTSPLRYVKYYCKLRACVCVCVF